MLGFILVSVVIALPAMLLRYVFVKRPISKPVALACVVPGWIGLVSLGHLAGWGDTPVFIHVGTILSFSALVAPQRARKNGRVRGTQAGQEPRVAAAPAGPPDRSYTTAELEQALFPTAESGGQTRGSAPQPSLQAASSPETPPVVLPLPFAPAGAAIPPQDAKEQLETLGRVLTLPQYAAYRVRIEGHTDSREAPGAEAALSLKRAEEVKRYLVQHCALAPERLVVQGYGASRSRATNETPEGRRRNRRVEIVNLGRELPQD